MKKTQYLLVSLLFLLTNCSWLGINIFSKYKEDENGVVISQPDIWQTDYSIDDAYIEFVIPTYPAFYQGKVLSGYSSSAKTEYLGLDIEKGRKQWNTEIENWGVFTVGYQFNEKLIVPTDQNIYCINIDNGKLLYDISLSGLVSRNISGLENKFYLPKLSEINSIGNSVVAAWQGNTENGELEEIYCPDLSNLSQDSLNQYEEHAGGVTHIAPFKSSNGTNYLSIIYKINKKEHAEYFVVLFNIDTKKLVSEMPLYMNIPFVHNIIVHDEKLYIVSAESVFCLDIFSNEILWENNTNQLATYSGDGFLIKDNVLIVVKKNDDSQIVGMDTRTGDIIWSHKTTVLHSIFQELNGVLYYATEENVYAVNIVDGTEYWRLECPRGWWVRHCVAIPGENGEKGKIIANSVYSTYCYEAVR